MRLEIVDAALDEAEAARNHYASREAGLGDAFARDFAQSIAWIEAQPLAWALVGKRARRRLLDRFPYAVIYRVEKDLIRVVAVMHQRQRPGYWRSR